MLRDPNYISYYHTGEFLKTHQTIPLKMCVAMNKDLQNHSLYFTYFKLRAGYSYSGGNLFTSDLEDISKVIRRQKRTTVIHLNKLVELGYLRKTDFGWQIISASYANGFLYGRKSHIVFYDLKEMINWTLAQFKSFLYYAHMGSWDIQRRKWEYEKTNDVKGYEHGKPYDSKGNLIPKRNLKKPSANLSGRNVSLSLSATVTNTSKATAQRRFVNNTYRKYMFLELERQLWAELNPYDGMELHHMLQEDYNGKKTVETLRKIVINYRKYNKLKVGHQSENEKYAVNMKVTPMGRYIVSSDFTKLYFQPASIMRKDVGFIRRALVDKKRTMNYETYKELKGKGVVAER